MLLRKTRNRDAMQQGWTTGNWLQTHTTAAEAVLLSCYDQSEH
jgi:hypothetical protein